MYPLSLFLTCLNAVLGSE